MSSWQRRSLVIQLAEGTLHELRFRGVALPVGKPIPVSYLYFIDEATVKEAIMRVLRRSNDVLLHGHQEVFLRLDPGPAADEAIPTGSTIFVGPERCWMEELIAGRPAWMIRE